MANVISRDYRQLTVYRDPASSHSSLCGTIVVLAWRIGYNIRYRSVMHHVHLTWYLPIFTIFTQQEIFSQMRQKQDIELFSMSLLIPTPLWRRYGKELVILLSFSPLTYEFPVTIESAENARSSGRSEEGVVQSALIEQSAAGNADGMWNMHGVLMPLTPNFRYSSTSSLSDRFSQMSLQALAHARQNEVTHYWNNRWRFIVFCCSCANPVSFCPRRTKTSSQHAVGRHLHVCCRLVLTCDDNWPNYSIGRAQRLRGQGIIHVLSYTITFAYRQAPAGCWSWRPCMLKRYFTEYAYTPYFLVINRQTDCNVPHDQSICSI